jgi:hypothetical protein
MRSLSVESDELADAGAPTELPKVRVNQTRFSPISIERPSRNCSKVFPADIPPRAGPPAAVHGKREDGGSGQVPLSLGKLRPRGQRRRNPRHARTATRGLQLPAQLALLPRGRCQRTGLADGDLGIRPRIGKHGLPANLSLVRVPRGRHRRPQVGDGPPQIGVNLYCLPPTLIAALSGKRMGHWRLDLRRENGLINGSTTARPGVRR